MRVGKSTKTGPALLRHPLPATALIGTHSGLCKVRAGFLMGRATSVRIRNSFIFIVSRRVAAGLLRGFSFIFQEPFE